MTKISYIKGDATKPVGSGLKLIIHCCNDLSPGQWGSGFVLALSKRWILPEIRYRRWSIGIEKTTQNSYQLGEVQFVPVEDDITVGNMIGQHGIKQINNITPIRYDAIDSCLKKVVAYVKTNPATVHAPRFGAGLAQGSWSEIEKLVIDNLCKNDIMVTVYDLKP